MRRALAALLQRDSDFPLVLVNKRGRESMNSWLNESPGVHRPRRTTVVEVHPDDAAARGIANGDLVRLSSRTGTVELRAEVSDAMRAGVVCVPHGWGSRVFDPGGAAEPIAHGVNRNLLVDGKRIDALSQTPAFNSTSVRLEVVPSPT